MKSDRWPVKIHKWDKSLNLGCWYSQLKHILYYCNMEDCLDDAVKCDLDVLEARLKVLNRNKWWNEAAEKPKLRTFIEIQDRNLRQVVVRKNMSRAHRSVTSKFICGVLPLMIEVGRFKDVPLEDRICRICDKKEVESELHFLGICPALKEVRERHLKEFPVGMIDVENFDNNCMKSMLHPDYTRRTSNMLVDLFEARKVLMYNVIDDDE